MRVELGCSPKCSTDTKVFRLSYILPSLLISDYSFGPISSTYEEPLKTKMSPVKSDEYTEA